MTMLFADIRGSTALSEKMRPKEFSQLINRFYAASTKVIIEEDGLVEKLAVMKFFEKFERRYRDRLWNDSKTWPFEADANAVKGDSHLA